MNFLSYLLESNIINSDIFEIAESSGYISSEKLEDFLLNATDISEEDLAILKSKFYELEYTHDDAIISSDYVIDTFDYSPLNSMLAIPYRVSADNLEVDIAIHNPEDIITIDNIKRMISNCQDTQNLKVKFQVAKKSTIISALKKRSQIKCFTGDNQVDKFIFESIDQGASDIHISPYENTCEIKHRIDGTLKKVKTLSINKFHAMCVSIKVMAKLDISETRRPQSGHFQHGNIVDLRVSTQPTVHGENISIRILNKNKKYINIENIGFNPHQIAHLKKISQFSHGMIIFCGPTGSGKTTSIYSMLATIDKNEKNVMTLEDPVEYRIHGVKQTEIRDGVIDFATGVRSILRQDPDVIFIGEIRDIETARMAIRAAMTGHLVFTTIHANDSISAIKRFTDFGISPFLVADNIISIVSQRLVKLISGGRSIISEILHIDNIINNMIYNNCSKEEILEYAKKHTNFKTIEDDGIEKIKAGLITENEMKHIFRNV